MPVAVARRKAVALLAYLAVTRQAHGRDTLVALLWPEIDGEHGHAVLRSTLADLSQAIGKEALAVAGDQVACQAPPLRWMSRVSTTCWRRLPPTTIPQPDLRRLPGGPLRRGRLYRADFLAGFTLADAVEFDAWQTFQTESLRLELAATLEKLAQGLAGRRNRRRPSGTRAAGWRSIRCTSRSSPDHAAPRRGRRARCGRPAIPGMCQSAAGGAGHRAGAGDDRHLRSGPQRRGRGGLSR